MVAIGITVSEETEVAIPDIDFFIFESLGFTIVAIFTAPITSSYCLVTIVLARIFLKERLTRKQYLSLAFLVTGIALLGISEIFNP